jgi:integrase
MAKQDGQLKASKGGWRLRYYLPDGTRQSETLGFLKDYPTEDSIYPVYQLRMSQINKPAFRPEIGTLLQAFVVDYFNDVAHLRGSTIRGYRSIWNNHLEPRLGHLRIRDVRTFECQQAMDSIVRANPKLKQASLSRVKSFLHEIFAKAIRLGLRESDVNPASGVKIQCARHKKTETFAYTLNEIDNILLALPEPSRVLMAIAAYTGLRRGEIVGLKWEDYDGSTLWVRRNICFGQKGEMNVEAPKTEASTAPVPVIGSLREILNAWKAKADATDGCWIFQAGFTRKRDHAPALLDAASLTPLSPANVLRDVVIPVLTKTKIEWLGYHAFRRGLATNLRALGLDDLTISEILRHSDVQVTRASYIKRVSQKSIDGLDKLETELHRREEIAKIQ